MSLRALHFDDDHRVVRTSLALLMPFLALAIALISWRIIEPYAWLLFYPAVFVSATLGGRRVGLIATALSTFLVWWFLLRPASLAEHRRAPPPRSDRLFRHRSCVCLLPRAVDESGRGGQQQQQLVTDPQGDDRAAAALAEGPRRLPHLHGARRNSSDFIGVADPNGTPTYLNPAGRRMVGLSAKHRVEDTTIPDYYPPAQRSFVESVIIESMRKTGQWQGETYFRNWQTEEAIPVSDRHFMIRDSETAKILGMATITRDISDKRQVQAELERTNEKLVEAREFLENVLESSTEYSIIAKDLERRVLAWNEGAARNYGYAASEVVGRSSDMLARPRGAAVGRCSGPASAGPRRGQGHRPLPPSSQKRDGVRRSSGDHSQERRPRGSHRLLARQPRRHRRATAARTAAILGRGRRSAASPPRLRRHHRSNSGARRRLHGRRLRHRRARRRGGAPASQGGPRRPRQGGAASALERFSTRAPPSRLGGPEQRTAPAVRGSALRAPPLHRQGSRTTWRCSRRCAEESAILVPLILRRRTVGVLTIVSTRADRRYGPEDLHLAEDVARRASLALDNARLYEVAQEAIRARDHVLGVVAHDPQESTRDHPRRGVSLAANTRRSGAARSKAGGFDRTRDAPR